MIRAVLVFLLLARPAAAEPGVLDVAIKQVRNDRGHILVAVCDATTFTSTDCPYRARAAAQSGTVVVRVTGIPAGRYAVQAFHDENDNGKLDRTLLGMPAEGLGFSRDAPMHFGPPEFAAAEIIVPAAGGRTEFALRY